MNCFQSIRRQSQKYGDARKRILELRDLDRVIRGRPRRQPIARHAGLGSFLMRVEVLMRVIANILRLNWSRLSKLPVTSL